MKLDTVQLENTSNIDAEAEFGMDKKDMPHITNLLRKQIYSDKLMAILREYSTNAYDAHVDASIQQIPIEITLPTLTNQRLSIRDFGEGLTEQDVMKIYIKYGASTKRNSNSVTGCLGIGCKSGFAYSSQFTITTYKNNVVTEYLARIDENNIGTISKLSENNTDESNGVKVSIPISQNDHEELRTKAKHLFKFWKVRPKINIELPEITFKKEEQGWALVDASNNGYQRRSISSTIFMGNIPYPVDTNILNSGDQRVNSLLNCNNMVIYAPLGSLDIAASRESLEYTSRTKNSLLVFAKRACDDLASEINAELNQIKSPIKAAIKAEEYLSQLDYDMKMVIKESINFKGQRLVNQLAFNTHTVRHTRFHRYRANDYVNKRKNDIRSASIKGNMFLCVWDPSAYSESNATRRIRTLQNEGGWNENAIYYMIKKENVKHITPALITEDLTPLDTIEPLKANRTIIDKDGTAKKKTKISVCKIQQSHLKSGRLSENIDTPTPESNGKYYYVPLDRYDWMGKPSGALDNVEFIQDAIKLMNDILKGVQGYCPNIWGVKKHHVKHVEENDDWVELDKYLLTLWEACKKKLPKDIETAQLCEATHTGLVPSNYYTHKVYVKTSDKNLRRLARVYQLEGQIEYGIGIENWDEDSSQKSKMLNRLVDTMLMLGLIERSKRRIEMEEALREKHPLLDYLNGEWNEDQDKVIKAINTYLDRN
jgi:hypothetical protein